MELIVTPEMRLRAQLHGACREGVPKVGDDLTRIPQAHLCWCENAGLVFEKLPAPLWALASDGYGHGYGGGLGCGDGGGLGCGDGGGLGCGDGDGHGDGYGVGGGDGDGYGGGLGYGLTLD